MTWRYIAQRIAGPDAGKFLHWNLPLKDVSLTTGIGSWFMEANLSHSSPGLTDEAGLKLFDPWKTAIWAEQDGVIRGGGILAASPYSNGRQVNVAGYGSYCHGLIYSHLKEWIDEDPLNIYRYLWDYVQTKIVDLDVTVSDATSSTRLGTPPKQVEFTTKDGEDVSFWSNDGPYRLEWWETPVIGETMNWLLSYVPAEMAERHWWEGDVIRHHIDIGVPTLGRRRKDLRFALGENIIQLPEIIENYDDYANHIIALGVGEGRTTLRVEAFAENDDRLRRTATIVRPAVKTTEELARIANKELARRRLGSHIDSIVVRDHGNARIGSWHAGDEILVQADLPNERIKQWRRVMSTTFNPMNPKDAILTLEAPNV